MCQHQPVCPAADAPDHAAARVVAHQDDLGWSLLCNGVIAFEDTGEIRPDGTTCGPLRPRHQPGRSVSRLTMVAA